MFKENNMKENIYFNDQPYLWNMLKDIIDQHRCNYGKIITSGKYSHLYNWINQSLPLLTQPIYHISTKCFWILNGLVDFPICATCGAKLINRNASIHLGYKHRALDTQLFCSIKCAKNNSIVNDKAKATRLKHFNQYQPLDFKEKVEKTKLRNFGDPHFTNKEKAKKTLYEKTGYDHNWKDPKCRQKCSLTYRKKTGYDQPLLNQQIKEQAKLTKYKRYGSDTYNNPKKAKQTSIERRGVDHHMKLIDFQHKVENTKKQKYGYAHFNILQSKKTMLKRYGKEFAAQVHEIRIKQQQKYYYHDIFFDSLPELAYYIWLKDHDIQFIYQPDIQLKYMFNNVVHFYMPDFVVNDQLIELKGNQFFKDGDPMKEMICPYDNSLNELYEAKHQCMLANNVKILTSIDYMKYIEYVNDTYGKTYLKSFKHSSKNVSSI